MYARLHDLILGFVVATSLGEEIMSHVVSICSHRYNPPTASEILHIISREQGQPPDTIMNSAPVRREIEAQLVMDRLLRECLTGKIATVARTAS